MSQKHETLTALLKELLQLNQPDLDFGIYRVLHARSAEVSEFLDTALLPQVRDAVHQYTTANSDQIQGALATALEHAQGLGVDPESTSTVKDLRRQLATDAAAARALEDQVYDHLYAFFRRYYSDGDFLTKRVYKPGVYAIPYEGEELTLHWANKDQYYIKTSDYLRDYAFRLRPTDEQQPLRVRFRLAAASEGEHGDVKAPEGKERRFVLAPTGASGRDFLVQGYGEQGEELIILFEYRPATLADWPAAARPGKKRPPLQRDLTAFAVQRVLTVTDAAVTTWITELRKPHVMANGDPAKYSRLEAHLKRYAARNTFDYFIHKDLGSFLRRELDFYIKNEIMYLDDVETETAQRVEQYLFKLQIIRKIAGKMIDFLAQIEDFQKKLWLKKKFVLQTTYCITLDRVPEALYPEILANARQRDEWIELFAIDRLADAPRSRGPRSGSLTIGFLKQNPHLVVDTAHFDAAFTAKLLASIADLQSSLDGVLIHGDNFHALNLLHRWGRSLFKCAYIDPPYNTETSAIPYKNDYRHSSWCTMIRDRLAVAHSLLKADGAIFVSIDKTERTILEHALSDVFGSGNHIEELIWTQATANSQLPNYSTNHEYVEVYAKSRAAVERDLEMFREPKPGYAEVMALVQSLRVEYPPVNAVEAAIKALFEQHLAAYRDEWEATGQEWGLAAKRQDVWRGIYPYKRAEYRDSHGRLVPEQDARRRNASIWVWSEISAAAPASKQSPTTRDPHHSNYRYYRPLHPVTGKPCQHPRSGWKFPKKPDPDNPSRRSFEEFAEDDRIAWGENERKLPRTKGFLHEVETNIGTSVFYSYNDGESELNDVFGESGLFLSPKSSRFVRKFIRQATRQDDWFMDFFAGTGSSGHAIVAQNREDGGRRKHLLVEVGHYFDSLLLPRMKKASYATSWKAGRPVSGGGGGNQMFKVLRLESYEDTLNNLHARRSTAQESLLHTSTAVGLTGLKEDYLLRYMLDVETRGSQSLLNVAAFRDPTAYQLTVKAPGSDESREVNVSTLR